jgi:hypothetical protein
MPTHPTVPYHGRAATQAKIDEFIANTRDVSTYTLIERAVLFDTILNEVNILRSNYSTSPRAFDQSISSTGVPLQESSEFWESFAKVIRYNNKLLSGAIARRTV